MPQRQKCHVVCGDHQGSCDEDTSPYNVGLEGLAEPMCLSSTLHRKDKFVLLRSVGNTAPYPASEQQSAIALGGEKPEKQRGDEDCFPLLFVILKAVMLKTHPGCNLATQFPITTTG